MKWLYEISHTNPLWIATADARALGIETGDLVKVDTRIGYFVTRAWVTEGIRPGVSACRTTSAAGGCTRTRAARASRRRS